MMTIQNLKEATHMSALEFMGQIHRKGEVANGMLSLRSLGPKLSLDI